MEQDSKIIDYQGYLNYEITGEFIEKLRNVKDDLNLKKSTYRKIVTVMVEIMENNYKYVNELNSMTLKQSSHQPFLLLTKEGNYYKLRSGNPILKKDAEALTKKIDRINQLEYAELKELYKNTMAEGIYENEKGAGLGIMKVAKISKNKIRYSLENLTDDLYYYTIEISIPVNHKN